MVRKMRVNIEAIRDLHAFMGSCFDSQWVINTLDDFYNTLQLIAMKDVNEWVEILFQGDGICKIIRKINGKVEKSEVLDSHMDTNGLTLRKLFNKRLDKVLDGSFKTPIYAGLYE